MIALLYLLELIFGLSVLVFVGTQIVYPLLTNKPLFSLFIA